MGLCWFAKLAATTVDASQSPPLGQVDDWIFIEMVKEEKTKQGCYLGLRALNIQPSPYLCCRMDTLSHSFWAREMKVYVAHCDENPLVMKHIHETSQ